MPVSQDDLIKMARSTGVSPATARRYFRNSVFLPDGREIHGWSPGAAAVTLEEHALRDELAKQVGGITEACLPFGRADVMTETAVFEVETAAKWRAGIRQVLAYAAQCGLRPQLALFGYTHRDGMKRIRGKLSEGPQAVVLWWWTGTRWERFGWSARCRAMPGSRPAKPIRAPENGASYVPRVNPADLGPGWLQRQAAPSSIAATWADGWEMRHLDWLRLHGFWNPSAVGSDLAG